MTRLATLAGLMAAGVIIAWLAGVEVRYVAGSPGYAYLTSLLLAVGLYGSTYAINLVEARRNRRLIVLAVTVGVLLKAVLIGASLALAWRDPLFLILAVVVAQIDPLAVAAILDNERMSVRARTILAAWSSLDDPVTVVLAVYAGAVATGFGLGNVVEQGIQPDAGPLRYGVDLAANLAFAGVGWLAWRGVRHRHRWQYVLLAVLGAVAVWQFLMLGLALVGLFLRPARMAATMPRLTQVALAASAVLLGVLLLSGADLWRGLALGAAAFGAQIVVSLALTRRLSHLDRLHLALAQQNGITSIILALRLESQFAGVVAVVAPAILVTNVIYLAANKIVDRTRHVRP